MIRFVLIDNALTSDEVFEPSRHTNTIIAEPSTSINLMDSFPFSYPLQSSFEASTLLTNRMLMADNRAVRGCETPIPLRPSRILNNTNELPQSTHTSLYDCYSTESFLNTCDATCLSPSSSSPSYQTQLVQDQKQLEGSSHLGLDGRPALVVIPYQPMRPRPPLRRQRIRSDLHTAIGPNNIPLSLDPDRQKLLDHILAKNWYREHQAEPTFGTQEADNILFYLNVFYNISFPEECMKIGRSVYTLFTDPTIYKCLMCNSTKKSAQRAVDCVRAHIRHRNFRCLGWRSECGICLPGQE
jgi:hypothetical protein